MIGADVSNKFELWEELKHIRFNINVKQNKRFVRKYCESITTFDSETSNGFINPKTGVAEGYNLAFGKTDKGFEYYHNAKKVSCLYHWQVAVETQTGIKAFSGRDYMEFYNFLTQLTDEVLYCCEYDGVSAEAGDERDIRILNAKLAKHRPTIYLWIHNLGFDFQFLRNLFNEEMSHFAIRKGKLIQNTFAREERKPMKSRISFNGCDVILRDSLCLTQKSLKDWTEKFPVAKIPEPKTFYLEVRTPLTPLTDEELTYNLQDVVSMVYGLDDYRDRFGTLEDIPLTQTGIIRRRVREEMEAKGKEWGELCSSIQKSYSKAEFLTFVRMYMGGWTHTNHMYSGSIRENLVCYDFASSYPSVMTSTTFPISRFNPCGPDRLPELMAQDLDSLDCKYRYYIEFSCENVSCKLSNTFLSASKMIELENDVQDNGKICGAGKLRAVLTDYDWVIFNQVYDFENLQVHELRVADAGFLPDWLILLILDYFAKKTSLKGTDQAALYVEAKEFINSIYGVAVYKMVSDAINFIKGEWSKDKSDTITEDEYEEMIGASSEPDKCFLCYQHGVWVAAAARYRLWQGIINNDEAVCYGDTDSLKGHFTAENIKWFDSYNESLHDKHVKIASMLGVDPSVYWPKDSEGNIHELGIWDRENNYDKAVFLGAKRYCAEVNGELHMTVAGLPKAAVSKLTKIEDFTTGTVWNCEESLKSIHFYNDNQGKVKWVDRDGVKYTTDEQYGICIMPTSFDLSIAEPYEKFLNFLQGSITAYYGDIPEEMYFENISK